MPAAIVPVSELPAHLPARGALLGLDLGTKTIGVAASDPDRRVAAGVETVARARFTADAERLLSLAAERGYRVDSYRDTAVGLLGKDAAGRLAITKVTLRPHVAFTGDRRPDAQTLQELHTAAHDSCFLAASVKAEVCCEPDAGA